jgi:cell division protein FtsW (lipid II flippase)
MPAARLAWLLLVPLPATAVGAVVASLHGVALAAFLPNALAHVLGALGALALWSSTPEGQRRAARWLPLAASLAIAATLVMPDLEGVRRWLPLGPLRVNASAALLPWLFFGLISAEPQVRIRAVVLACGVQLVHLAQPDAAQATALAAAALPLLAAGTVVGRRAGIPVAALLVGLAAAAWMRPDALPAIDYVERIFALAGASGPWWSAAAGMATFGLLVPAMIAMRRPKAAEVQLGAGFALYACAAIGATFFGSYPVPVLGAGAGPVLGWYAMISVIALRMTTAWNKPPSLARPAPS